MLKSQMREDGEKEQGGKRRWYVTLALPIEHRPLFFGTRKNRYHLEKCLRRPTEWMDTA